MDTTGATPPGAPPPAGPGLPAGWPPPPAPGPRRRTNPLAIVSLVAGVGQVVALLPATITAIVTGHLARARIRRSGGTEEGAGMALAGLILGYVGAVLTVLAIAGIITAVVLFSDDWTRAGLRDDAHDYADRALALAATDDTTPRDPDVLVRAYVIETTDGYVDAEVRTATGVDVARATRADWERSRWRAELSSAGEQVCLVIPATLRDPVRVDDGRCTGVDTGVSAGALRSPPR